jgi:hypothetical protein
VTQRAKELPNRNKKEQVRESRRQHTYKKREERKESSSKSTSLSFELIEQKTKEKREG